MKNAKATRLTWTAVFLALAGVSGWFVYRRAPLAGAAVVGGLVGSVLLVMLVGSVRAIAGRIVEWWHIAGARLGREPRDGRRTALMGPLRGHGALEAPFSRESCLLYSYEIMAVDVSGRETSLRKAYDGFATVPLSIEHGPERISILAMPELLSVPATPLKSAAAQANATLFIGNTTFAPTGTEAPDVSHTDGRIRRDHRHDPVPDSIGVSTLVERLVRTDTNVCAIGTYNADRRALVAPVRLRTGGSFVIGAAWRIVNAVIGTAILAAIALAAGALFCANFPIDAVEQLHPNWTLSWWEVDLDRFVERHVRMPMTRAGMLTSSGFRLQSLCDGCAQGRLEIDGRTIELKHAAYAGGTSVHLSAKPGDRDGVTLTGSNRVVLTVDGKSAEVPSSWLFPYDVVTALGSNGEYAGRITVIAADGWIRCRVSFNTRVDADAWLRRAR
ncbi:MAG TPA: hypothetical protein VNI54_05685 [Thermoanaerobaculia bacterium]|nr:hypothetical protein [Thermoanaerobaculia bacterium]